MNNKSIVDEYHRPKMAYADIRRHFQGFRAAGHSAHWPRWLV
jgi:hypothetical protein